MIACPPCKEGVSQRRNFAIFAYIARDPTTCPRESPQVLSGELGGGLQAAGNIVLRRDALVFHT